MITENQAIDAIQNILQSCDIKENFSLFLNIDIAVENESIDLDYFKSIYRDISQNYRGNNYAIKDLFDVLLLKHDKYKTLYLIKGLKVVMSNKRIEDLSRFEIEEVCNFQRTIEDNGVKEEFARLVKEMRKFNRYNGILRLI